MILLHIQMEYREREVEHKEVEHHLHSNMKTFNSKRLSVSICYNEVGCDLSLIENVMELFKNYIKNTCLIPLKQISKMNFKGNGKFTKKLDFSEDLH